MNKLSHGSVRYYNNTLANTYHAGRNLVIDGDFTPNGKFPNSPNNINWWWPYEEEDVRDA